MKHIEDMSVSELADTLFESFVRSRCPYAPEYTGDPCGLALKSIPKGDAITVYCNVWDCPLSIINLIEPDNDVSDTPGIEVSYGITEQYNREASDYEDLTQGI